MPEPRKPCAEAARLDMSVKHPLADAWTFYYEPDARSRARSKNWLDSLTKLPSVDAIEDFWALWSKLPRPSLLHDSSVYLFRSDRAPSWERWPKGGKWVVTGTGLDVDAAWESLCLAMLGEQLEEPEEVCGGVCSAGRLAVWTSSASGEQQSARLRELLSLTPEVACTFKLHAAPWEPRMPTPPRPQTTPTPPTPPRPPTTVAPWAKSAKGTGTAAATAEVGPVARGTGQS